MLRYVCGTFTGVNHREGNTLLMGHQHKVALPRSYATRVAHSSNVVNVLVSFLCTVHKKTQGWKWPHCGQSCPDRGDGPYSGTTLRAKTRTTLSAAPGRPRHPARGDDLQPRETVGLTGAHVEVEDSKDLEGRLPDRRTSPFKAVVSNDTCADRGSPKKDQQPSFLYSLCCRIMYVRVRHSPSTHHAAHAGTIRMAYKVEIFNILDMNFREPRLPRRS
jgi:hypothetical protein